MASCHVTDAAERWPAPTPRGLLARFRSSTRGVAALEFALVAPFLIALFLGGFELARYINTMRKLTYLANSIAQMLAQNTSGSVSNDDLHFAIDSTVIVFPDVLSDSKSKGLSWWQDIQVTMSSVAFTPTVSGCTSNCTYVAKTVWSGAVNARPCSVPLTPASDTATPSPSTLPTDVYGPGSIIVVDVVYNYTPVVANNIFGTMTVHRSAYIQPRYVSLVNFSSTPGDMATKCPGY